MASNTRWRGTEIRHDAAIKPSSQDLLTSAVVGDAVNAAMVAYLEMALATRKASTWKRISFSSIMSGDHRAVC